MRRPAALALALAAPLVWPALADAKPSIRMIDPPAGWASAPAGCANALRVRVR
jgi:hypothetical protein